MWSSSSSRVWAHTVVAHSVCGTIEAVKAVAELFAPVSGEVVDVNPVLEDHPETLNSDPYEGAG